MNEELYVSAAPKGKYWAVTAKGGHVGRRRYIPLTFAVKAASAKEAAAVTMRFPRVKRQSKGNILSVTAVDFAHALELVQANIDDPYFSCHCVQDQRAYVPDIYTRIIEEIEEHVETQPDAGAASKEFYAGKTKIRKNPKFFQRYHPNFAAFSTRVPSPQTYRYVFGNSAVVD